MTARCQPLSRALKSASCHGSILSANGAGPSSVSIKRLARKAAGLDWSARRSTLFLRSACAIGVTGNRLRQPTVKGVDDRVLGVAVETQRRDCLVPFGAGLGDFSGERQPLLRLQLGVLLR